MVHKLRDHALRRRHCIFFRHNLISHKIQIVNVPALQKLLLFCGEAASKHQRIVRQVFIQYIVQHFLFRYLCHRNRKDQHIRLRQKTFQLLELFFYRPAVSDIQAAYVESSFGHNLRQIDLAHVTDEKYGLSIHRITLPSLYYMKRTLFCHNEAFTCILRKIYIISIASIFSEYFYIHSLFIVFKYFLL